MSDKLTTQKGDNLPFKALPSDAARQKKVLELGVWLDGILSLDGDKSVRRLEVLLPIIKDEAWGLSLNQVKEAFTMYVKSELMYNRKLLEPRDNFLTVILFNKILQAYRDAIRNRKKPVEVDHEELKRLEDYSNVISAFDSFSDCDKLPKDSSWIYYYLEARLDDFVFTNREKQLLMKLGADQKLSEPEAKEKAMITLVRRYFDKLIAKNIHLKEILK